MSDYKYIKLDYSISRVISSNPVTMEFGFELQNGSKYWNKDGKLHRLDGPAVICWDGSKQWWIDGEPLSKEKQKLLNIWYENKSKS